MGNGMSVRVFQCLPRELGGFSVSVFHGFSACPENSVVSVFQCFSVSVPAPRTRWPAPITRGFSACPENSVACPDYSGFQCFSVSWFQCFMVSVFHGFSVSVFQCFSVSVFQCFSACPDYSGFQCLPRLLGVSVFQCFSVSVFQCFSVSVFQCFSVSVPAPRTRWFQCFSVSWFQCLPRELGGFSVSVFHGFSACPETSVVKELKGVRGTRDPSLSSGQAPGRGTGK
jgi:hypothetical protein